MPRLLRALQLVSLALVALLMLAACGSRVTAPEKALKPLAVKSPQSPQAQLEKPSEAAITAEALRVTLNNTLREHVFLTTAATGAAIAGNADGLKGATKALKEGTAVGFADLLGKIYDDQTRDSFLTTWSSHIDMVMAYANGLAKDDKAAQDKAIADLGQYTKNLAAALEKTTGLTASASEPLIAEHITTLRSVVDKQKAGDTNGAYTDLRSAMSYVGTIATPLAVQIAKQKGLQGAADSKAADLQAKLNGLLQEHVFLTGAATSAALSGNTAGFEAASKAEREGNAVDLANAIAEVYDKSAGDALLKLWNSQLDLFVSYANGLATNDKAVQGKTIVDLTGYAGSLASEFERVTGGGLPSSASTSLIQQNVMGLKTAVDLQKTSGPSTAYTELRETAQHMRMIADSLAQAIVKQKSIS